MKPDVVSVVGGGFSFREVAHDKVPGYVIAANDAAILLQRPVDEIVSMDRLWTEHRWLEMQERRVTAYLRRSALKNVVWEGEEWVRQFECDNESVVFEPDDAGRLNGTNSGTCAINRAYQHRPRRMFLFGFDMCRAPDGNAYWYAPYPWAAKTKGNTKAGTYQTWAAEFNRIALQFAEIGCEVINVSAHSKITAFQKFSPTQLGMGK